MELKLRFDSVTWILMNTVPKHIPHWKVTNIEYDTDGEEIDLPTELGVFCDEEEIADAISDYTGWCVISFDYELYPF